MTPEQLQQLNDIQERLLSIETVSNNDNNELVIDNLIKRRTDVVDAKVNLSQGI